MCCVFGFFWVVDLFQVLQFWFVKVLYVDGDVVYFGVLIINEVIGFYGIWVGFYGDFCFGGQWQVGVDVIQQGLYGWVGQQVWCFVVDKNSVYFLFLGILCISLQIVQQMLDVVIMWYFVFQCM